MRKYFFILAMILFLVSCKEKEEGIVLPAWLQERIAADEKDISADHNTYKILGAWIQFRYNKSIYFEYHNLIFSSMPKVYYYDGTEMNFALPVYDEYQKGKCCKEIVWKGEGYIDH